MHMPVIVSHDWPDGHAGHWRTFPQPSLAVPHWMPWAAQDFGLQVPASSEPH
jgi:hypothetical protein